MELREEWAIPLSIYSDELFPFSYVRVITPTHYESFKLSTQIESCKFKHLLNPNYTIKCELIKTRKNWILKSILEYKAICHPDAFSDYLKQAEMVKIISEHVTQDQEVEIYDFVAESLGNLTNIKLKEFKKDISKKLGF
jgi:hypothetical protein